MGPRCNSNDELAVQWHKELHGTVEEKGRGKEHGGRYEEKAFKSRPFTTNDEGEEKMTSFWRFIFLGLLPNDAILEPFLSGKPNLGFENQLGPLTLLLNHVTDEDLKTIGSNLWKEDRECLK